jgi:nucleotide-binding universal stress UspA family protein
MFSNPRWLVLSVFTVSASLSGCATPRDYEPGPEDTIIAANYAAADQLRAKLGSGLSTHQPIAVAPVSPDAYAPTALSRLIAEQVSSRLSEAGYRVVSAKLKSPAAAYGLSSSGPEIRDTASALNAEAVIVGTYAVGAYSVYVSLKVIRTADNIVLAAHDYVLPLTRNVWHLLEASRGVW